MSKTKKKEIIAKTLFQFMTSEFDKSNLDHQWRFLQHEYEMMPGKSDYYRVANGILKKIEPIIIKEYAESVEAHPCAVEETCP